MTIFFQADFRNFKGSHNKFMVTDKWAYIGNISYYQVALRSGVGKVRVAGQIQPAKASCLSELLKEPNNIYKSLFYKGPKP